MVATEFILVMLVQLVDVVFPSGPEARARQRGRPVVYSETIMVKALLIMVVRGLYGGYALDIFLHQETELAARLRPLVSDAQGRLPSRRTWERRLGRLPARLPGLIGCLGRQLLVLLQPWQAADGRACGRAMAIDSTPLKARGGVWHTKDMQTGHVPSTAIDTEAHWSKSGYHGWWYGYKLHLIATVGRCWIPLAAELTPANVGDNTHAPHLLVQLPAHLCYVLGDQHYNDCALREQCAACGYELIATRRNQRSKRYPHTDGGVNVRRLFHRLRSKTIEPFNGLFKRIFEWNQCAPRTGLRPNQLIVLGAVLVYQLLLLLQWCDNRPIGQGLKPLLKAA